MSVPGVEDTSQEDGLHKWKAFGAVGSFFVTAVLAMTMVFVALPLIAEDFGVTLKLASWIIIAHALTISSLLLPFGRLADLVGRRRVHLAGLTLFGVGALLCALSTSFGFLLAARVVMAIGDALAQSVSTGILVAAFPQHERGKAIGSQTTAVAVGAASGPILAAVLLGFLPWRAIFAVLLIPTAVALVVGYLVLDADRVDGDADLGRKTEPTPSFDWVGATMSVSAIVLLVVTLNNPFGYPWLSAPVACLAVASVLLFAAFVRWELSTSAPMLNLRFFASPVFARAVVARVTGFMTASTIYILIPILLISLLGLGEGRAGIAISLNSLGVGITAQIAGRLSDRFGTRPFMIAGYAISAVTMLALSGMGRTTPFWVVAGTVFVAGLATGSWNVPNNSTIIGAVPSSSYGVVGAFTNLARNVGNVFGQAAVAAIIAGVMMARGFDVPLAEIGRSTAAGDAFLAGWRLALWVMAGLSVASLALVFGVRPERTAVAGGEGIRSQRFG